MIQNIIGTICEYTRIKCLACIQTPAVLLPVYHHMHIIRCSMFNLQQRLEMRGVKQMPVDNKPSLEILR